MYVGQAVVDAVVGVYPMGFVAGAVVVAAENVAALKEVGGLWAIHTHRGATP